MARSFLLFALIISASVFAAPFDATYDLSKGRSAVEFLSLADPSSLKIKGRSKAENLVLGSLKLENAKLSGSATYKVTEFDTGIELRNRHLREKLEFDKFPNSKFELDPVTLPAGFLSESPKSSTLPFTGKLTLHGVTKPVSGELKVDDKPSEPKFEFFFNVSLKDFEIKPPSFLGVTVKDTVEVMVTVQPRAGEKSDAKI